MRKERYAVSNIKSEYLSHSITYAIKSNAFQISGEFDPRIDHITFALTICHKYISMPVKFIT